MVVADGVTNSGDANCRPNRAAEVALGAAIRVIERELPSRARPGALNQWWRGVGALVMGEAARAIEQLAAPGLGPRVDKTPESTLAMACLGRIETKWTLFWTAVGDSEVALVREGKLRWVSLQQSVSDRYTRSATTFALPRHVGQAKSGIVALDPGDIVFVASDGCTDAFHEAPERQVDWLSTGLTSEEERTDAFTQVVGFEMADSYDDRTIVAGLVPRPGAHQTPAGGD
jgi:serine/threonine protein phosphatase PrpC